MNNQEKKEPWKNYIPFPDDLELVYIDNGYHDLHIEAAEVIAKHDPDWLDRQDIHNTVFPDMKPFNSLRHNLGSLRAFVRLKNGLLLSVWYNKNGINVPIFQMIGPTFEIYSFNYDVDQDIGSRFYSIEDVATAIKYLQTIDPKELGKSDWDEYDPELHGSVNYKGDRQ